ALLGRLLLPVGGSRLLLPVGGTGAVSRLRHVPPIPSRELWQSQPIPAVMPPSTTNSAPVQWALSSDARNSAMLAISSAPISLPTGIRDRMFSITSGPYWVSSVSIGV